ncbi:MAG: SulP family inorganic anion transporter [Oligoflexales bacterium]
MDLSLGSLRFDLRAGIVVALVALPLCLGIALASNAPLLSGLISGIIGGLVVSVISGSHTSVSGPAAGIAAVVASQISSLGSFDLFLGTVVLAGIFQILFGLMRTGFIASFFPNCVIKGLLAGIGILLILKQIPHLFGEDSDPTGDFAFSQINHETTFSQILTLFSHIELGACFIGLLSLAILLYGDHFRLIKRLTIPLPLFIVGLGVLLNYLFIIFFPQLAIGTSHLVNLPSLEEVQFKDLWHSHSIFSLITNKTALIGGLTIAVIASLETLLNLNAVDKLDPRQRISPPNRELVAQGVGNLICGFIGGLPITSVIVRSSANISAGNASKWSAFLHGILLTIATFGIPSLLNSIPLSSLAAILVATGMKLANPKLVKRMKEEGYHQLIPFLATIVGIVFTDLLVGIFIGLVCSIGFILYSNYKRAFKVEIDNSSSRKIVKIKLPVHVSFLAKPSLQRSLDLIPHNSLVQIDGRQNEFIDTDIQDLIIDFQEKSTKTKSHEIELMGLSGLSKLSKI